MNRKTTLSRRHAIITILPTKHSNQLLIIRNFTQHLQGRFSRILHHFTSHQTTQYGTHHLGNRLLHKKHPPRFLRLINQFQIGINCLLILRCRKIFLHFFSKLLLSLRKVIHLFSKNNFIIHFSHFLPFQFAIRDIFK